MRHRNLVHEKYLVLKFQLEYEKIRALSVRSEYLCIGNIECIVFVGLIGCTGIYIVREISDSV
jgi:hypothetical protein